MHFAQALAALCLDRSSSVPMFRQLYEATRQAILDNRIAPGTQMPPTREIAALLKVSRQTVLSAYNQLMAEGYLSATVGKGTFVSGQLPAGLNRLLKAAGTGGQAASLLRPLSERGQRFLDLPSTALTHARRPNAFRIGTPGLDVFPRAAWARLAARRWRKPSHEWGYGDPAGFGPLRELLAAYLNASRGTHCAPEQIIITSGSQQALFLIASLLLSPGDAAWVEMPGYPGTCAALHGAGARICPVPVDRDGLDVAAGAASYPDARLAYVTPSHQFPLGATMTLQRRVELLAWAAKHRMWIVEDEYDSEYRYTGAPIASLQSQDRSGSVLYVGTLSKVLFPGLRLGYVVVPPALVDVFTRGKAAIDRHTATAPQIVLADFIAEGHFLRHIKRTRQVYAERREALLEVFGSCLGDFLDHGPTDAGFHVATALRGKGSDKAITAAALERGVELRPLSAFYEAVGLPPGDLSPQGLLLGFAAATPEEIRRAAPVLAQILSRRWG